MAAFNPSASASGSASSTYYCQVCSDIHTAIFRCDECEENLCQVAASFHQKGKSTKNHALKAIESPPANDIISNLMGQLSILSPMITCPQHKEEFKYFDEDCKKLICRDCVVVSHHGHRCSFIKDAATSHRALLESSVQEARFQSDAIKKAEAEVSVVKSKLQEEYQQVHQSIGDLFDRVSSYSYID
jgi:hypothetical protein